MGRPSFIEWATSQAGVYLHDKKDPTLATWQPYQVDILNHIFPGGNGRLPYSRILWCDVKKSGKTELAYGVHLYFGIYVDVPGEQYVLANDFDGAKARVWRAIEEGLGKNPKLKKDKDWKTTGSEIKLSNGTTIKAIAADFAGEAGANHSLATVDEPWGIIHEKSLRLMTEFGPVPTRPSSTIFYTGYQGFEGQSAFWHNLIDTVLEGEPVPELLHIDDGEGKPACWRNGKMFLFWNHKGRQPWHTDEYYAEERKAYRGRENEYIRVHMNKRVKAASTLCSDAQWEKLYDPNLRGLYAGDKRSIVLGVDAAVKSDYCALDATTWNEETKKVENLLLDVWQPEPGKPIDLPLTVGARIVELHQKYNVVAVYYDPYQMAAIAQMCQRAGVKMVEFPQNIQRVQSDTHFHGLLWGGNFAHYGDPVLKEHVTNAVTAPQGQRGLRIVKDLTQAKIDGAVAASMSAWGTVQELAGGPAKEMKASPNPFYGG